MERMSSDMEQQTEWRRDKVQELCGKEYSQRDICQTLHYYIHNERFLYKKFSIKPVFPVYMAAHRNAISFFSNHFVLV